MTKSKIVVDACCHVPNAHITGRTGKGECACGVLIIDQNGTEHEFTKYLGHMTAPEAEFHGLVFALDQATSITRYEVEILMDSELVVKWMTGDYRMKKDHIRPLFDEAKKYEQRFKAVKYIHHSRLTPLGKHVDRLANAEYQKYHP